MRTYRLNYILILFLCCTAGLGAQTKKMQKSFKTNKDVTLAIDAQHTNIIVEKWDKNEVQVEAFLEGNFKDKKEEQAMLASWRLDASGSPDRVNINSGGGGIAWNPDMDLSGLEVHLQKLPEMIAPVMESLGPLLENIANHPLPPEVHQNLGDMKFDYEAYQKQGDKYLESWEKKVQERFGKNFEKSMEEWAANFEKDSAVWKKNFEEKMQKWGEEFGAGMEEWGKNFGKDMEKWGDEFEKQMEAKYGDDYENTVIINGIESKAKRTIKIKAPMDARLKLDVRHGEVKLRGNNTNLQADLSHSNFSAGSISGKNTSVSAAYTPVKVQNWKYGVLNAAYVKDCTIENVISIKLNSKSSDVSIGNLKETGILSGNFAKLVIKSLAPGFKNLDINLQNSDLNVDLPDAAFSFTYNGTQSKIKYPGSLSLKSSKSYDNETLRGFNKSQNADGTVNIKASFSDVLLN